MFHRKITEDLLQALKQFPALLLTGPRQAGKTTLARHLLDIVPGRLFDLENPRDLIAMEDPLGLLRGFSGLTVVDEAQRKPDLFPILRVLIDEDRRCGRFLLLGSSAPDLRRQSAESLAGRLCTFELQPLLLCETQSHSKEQLWLRGGFPPSLLAADDEASLSWREQYVRDVAERDLRLLGFDLPPARMWRFLQMLAHNHGQLWNASQISRALDIGATTAERYLDAIQQTLIVRRIQPFFKNLGKRLTKSPRVFIRDSGLLHALLSLGDVRAIRGHPVAGHSFEGFVAEQFAGLLRPGFELSFWRTAAGAEVDILLLRSGQPAFAIEVKLNATDPRPARGFYQACADLEPEHRWIVYPGDRELPLGEDVHLLPIEIALSRFASLTG